MKSCTENSVSTVASSNHQTIGGVEQREADLVYRLRSDCNLSENGLCQTAGCMKWENGKLVRPVVFVGCREKQAADLIEHQLSVIGELREALEVSADALATASLRFRLLENSGIKGTENGAVKTLTGAIEASQACQSARKALSHPIIGDKS